MSLQNSQKDDLIKITRQFLEVTLDMKKKGIITEDEYNEMTENKIKFLESVSN